ncbi:hypothetical protein I7634_01940 [Mycoplasma mycoides subsp. capri]|uniref:Mbov_0399 family ICE element protein n=1 Tax=Mycoplasma mycoides TaxID=2102 RepID=UPI00223ED6D8|nr:hypothetical protein [Mycoplasma mycoides]QVJ97579.1 hypothetical protein I7633_01940 [Mycoplasma mycoides subsp. capri]QVK00572.1 hypothetical protein I7634_01940 [Mycoplasma mycoides subsp. capri]QVK01459.1 hypothetical protein I7635_01940 [Mycoplasma mycoides subsp. capri]
MKKTIIFSSLSILPFMVGGIINHSYNIVSNNKWLTFKSTSKDFPSFIKDEIVEYKTQEWSIPSLENYGSYFSLINPDWTEEMNEKHLSIITSFPNIEFSGIAPKDFPKEFLHTYPYLKYHKGFRAETTVSSFEALLSSDNVNRYNRYIKDGYKTVGSYDIPETTIIENPIGLKSFIQDKKQQLNNKEVVELKLIEEYEDVFYRINYSSTYETEKGNKIEYSSNSTPLTNIKLQVTYKEVKTNPTAKFKSSWNKWQEKFNSLNDITIESDTTGDLNTKLNESVDRDFKSNKQILDEKIAELNNELNNDLTLSYKQLDDKHIRLFLNSNSSDFKNQLFISAIKVSFIPSNKANQKIKTQELDSRLKISLGKWVDFNTETTKLVDDVLVRDTSVSITSSGISRNAGRWIAHTPLKVSFTANQDETEILKINGERVDVLDRYFEKNLTDNRIDVFDNERILNGDIANDKEKPQTLDSSNSHAKNEYKIEITKFKDKANKIVEFNWTKTIVIDSKSSKMDFKWYAWNPENNKHQKDLIEEYLKDEKGSILKDKNGNNLKNPKYDPKIDPSTGTKKQLVWLNFKNMYYTEPVNLYSKKTNLPDKYKTLFKPHSAYDLDSGAIAEAVVINKGALRSISSTIKDYTVYRLDVSTGNYAKLGSKMDKKDLIATTTENTYFSSQGLWLFVSAADKSIANFKLVYIVEDNDEKAKDQYLTSMLSKTNNIIKPLWNTLQGREFYNYLITNKTKQLNDSEIEKLNYETAMEHYKSYINDLYNNYTYNSTITITPKFKNLDNKWTRQEFIKNYLSNLTKFKTECLDNFEHKDKVEVTKIEIRPDNYGIYVWFKLNTYNAIYELNQDVYSIDIKFKDVNTRPFTPGYNPSSTPGSNPNTNGNSHRNGSSTDRNITPNSGDSSRDNSSNFVKKSINLNLNKEYLNLLAKSSYKKDFITKLDKNEVFKNTSDEISKLNISNEFNRTNNLLTINVSLKDNYTSTYKLEPQNSFNVYLSEFLTDNKSIKDEAIEKINLNEIFKNVDLGHFNKKIENISIYSEIIDKLFKLNKSQLDNFYNVYKTYPKLKRTDFKLATIKKVNLNNKTKYQAVVYLDNQYLTSHNTSLDTLKHYYGTVDISFSTNDEFKETKPVIPNSTTPGSSPTNNPSSSSNRNDDTTNRRDENKPGSNTNSGDTSSKPDNSTTSSSSSTPGSSSNTNGNSHRNGSSTNLTPNNSNTDNPNSTTPDSSSNANNLPSPTDEINDKAIDDRTAIIDDENANNSSSNTNSGSSDTIKPFNPLDPNQPVDDKTTDDKININKDDIFSDLKLELINLNGIDDETEAKKFIINKLNKALPNLKLNIDYKISNLDSVVSKLKYPQINASSSYVIRNELLVLESILPRFGYKNIKVINTVNKIINIEYDLKTKKLTDIVINENKLSLLKKKVISEINKQFELEKFEVDKDIEISNLDNGLQILIRANNNEFEFIIKGLNHKIKNQTSVKIKNIAKFVVDDKSPNYKSGDENKPENAILYDLSNVWLRLHYEEHIMSELREKILDEISKELYIRYRLEYEKDYQIKLDELNSLIRELTVKTSEQVSKVLKLHPIDKVSKNFALVNIKNYNKLFNPIDDLHKPIRRIEERLKAERRKKLLLIFIPLSLLSATGIGLLAWFIYIRKVKNKIT